MAAALSALAFQREGSNYDEVSMHQTLLFADSLKDLKILRTQLYSAAEYFEQSFTNDDEKHMAVETLKAYAIKALVNTVDHLGSVAYKVNDLVEEKIGETRGTDLRISCIEQRLRTSKMYMNNEGRFQQSSAISTPKYHMRYNLPDGETLQCATRTEFKYPESSIDDDDEIAVRMAPDGTPTLTAAVSNQSSPAPLTQISQQPEGFFCNKPVQKTYIDKRTISPLRFPLFRSGSLSSKPTTPNPSRPVTPRTCVDRQQSPSEPQKSASMRFHADENSSLKESQHQPSKSKRLLKALVNRRKSKKDDVLYTFLDEY